MRVNLNLEEDPLFRAHIKAMMEGQVRSILREELNGMVQTELAKLRLLQPNSPALQKLVESTLEGAIKNTVHSQINTKLDILARDAALPFVKQLKKNGFRARVVKWILRFL